MIDDIVIGFFRDNPVTAGFTLASLKILANETEWVLDNKILSLLTLKGRKEFKQKT